MHAKYEVSITIQKLKQRLKLTTDKQTDRQDKNNMPLIIRFGGILVKNWGGGVKHSGSMWHRSCHKECTYSIWKPYYFWFGSYGKLKFLKSRQIFGQIVKQFWLMDWWCPSFVRISLTFVLKFWNLLAIWPNCLKQFLIKIKAKVFLQGIHMKLKHYFI